MEKIIFHPTGKIVFSTETICDDCHNKIKDDEIYYGPDGDFCAWCHTAKYGDDEQGKFTYQTSQKTN